MELALFENLMHHHMIGHILMLHLMKQWLDWGIDTWQSGEGGEG